MSTVNDIRGAVTRVTGHPDPFVEVVADEDTSWRLTVYVLAGQVEPDALDPLAKELADLRPLGTVLTVQVVDDGRLVAKLAET